MNSFAVKVSLMWLFLFSALVIYCFILCDNHLIYSLDDPYIHLDVARNILRGNYGINAGEPSSPSSSIIWPWMLAVTQFLGLKSAAPLILNAMAALATIYVSARLVSRLGFSDEKTGPGMTCGLGLIIILMASAFALPMTGLEHSWHVLTAVLVMDGLIAATEGKAPGPLFIVALIAMPLFRFEGAAFFLITVVAIWSLGYRRSAVTAVLCLFFCVAAYEAFMIHLGLPLLPTSVLTKEGIIDAASTGQNSSLVRLVGDNVRTTPNMEIGRMFIYSLLYLTFVAFQQRKNPRTLYIYIPVMCAVLAHIMFGKYGLMDRYEIYLIELAVLAICFSLSVMPDLNMKARQLILLAIGVPFVHNCADAALMTPTAAYTIYGQQYQMHRFVSDYYRGPVAINDLGLVSYGNDNYVLDLWGLGSVDVCRLRLAGTYDADAMDRLVKEHNVHLVMIFRSWFLNNTPRDWQVIGHLYQAKNFYGLTDVTFYAPPGADKDFIVKALRQFTPTLPAGTVFLRNADYFKS